MFEGYGARYLDNLCIQLMLCTSRDASLQGCARYTIMRPKEKLNAIPHGHSQDMRDSRNGLDLDRSLQELHYRSLYPSHRHSQGKFQEMNDHSSGMYCVHRIKLHCTEVVGLSFAFYPSTRIMSLLTDWHSHWSSLKGGLT